MKCVCCGHEIKGKEGRAYVKIGNRKRYGCWACNTNGTFEDWIDQLPVQSEGDDEWAGSSNQEAPAKG